MKKVFVRTEYSCRYKKRTFFVTSYPFFLFPFLSFNSLHSIVLSKPCGSCFVIILLNIVSNIFYQKRQQQLDVNFLLFISYLVSIEKCPFLFQVFSKLLYILTCISHRSGSDILVDIY